MKVAVHLANPLGGPRCPTKTIGVRVSAVPVEVTCYYCRRYLRKHLSPAEIAVLRRKGGKASAKLPECNIKFARIL